MNDPPFVGGTGGGVSVSVIDSGIVPGHPHVGAVERGAYFGSQESELSFVDRIGHGTAVAAAIREKAPEAELIAVRVFDRVLTTNAEVLARAIVWSADHGARLANLSLGTSNPARKSTLRGAVDRAASLGCVIVAADEAADGGAMFPGSLPGVISVRVGQYLARDQLLVEVDEESRMTWRASDLPRPIPGVPPERNLRGISFAVANVTGFLARLLESRPDLRSVDAIRRQLIRTTTE